MTFNTDSLNSIPEAFYAVANQQPNRTVYSQAQIQQDDTASRKWVSSSYGEVQKRVNAIAAYLKSIGIKKNSKVAIVSNSRPEWMEADIALTALGGVSVSIYQSLPASDIAYILFDSEALIVFAENQEQVDKLLEIQAGTFPIPATEDREATTADLKLEKIISFDPVSEHGLVVGLDEILKHDGESNPEEYKELSRDDLAALVYTSGTTGPPKGVMQTHGNHLSNVRQAYACQLVQEDSSIMLFLPLAHSFAKLMGYLGFLTPAELKFASIADRKSSKLNPASVTRDIREANANIVPIVPRLLEKMQDGIVQKSRAGGIGGKLIGATLSAAKETYEVGIAGRKTSILTRIVYSGTSSLRNKIREKLFGTEFRYCISGGAKLAKPVHLFFDALEVEIIEGYGLTETCVATNVNRYGAKKIGTVGPVLDSDIEIKFTDEGEICYRGPNIAPGYYNRETATKGAWDQDGWFHTGDLGSLDEDGYLTIEGRKKDILVLSNGKNVAPDGIEEQMKASRYISQIVLLGDNRPNLVALVSLNPEEVHSWATERGVTLDGPLYSNEKVYELIMGDVQGVNATNPKYEHVRKIMIVPEDFTVENGFLTPTFKIKRPVVQKRYKDEIDRLYGD